MKIGTEWNEIKRFIGEKLIRFGHSLYPEDIYCTRADRVNFYDGILVVTASGMQGSGKSHFTHLLEEHFRKYGRKSAVVSLAGPLYKSISELIGEPVDKEKTYEFGLVNPKSFTGRQLLQMEGTEFGRHNLHDQIWIGIALKKAKEEHGLKEGDILLVDDVRFPNELCLLSDVAFYMLPPNEGDSAKKQKMHRSEFFQEFIRSNADFVLQWRPGQEVYICRKSPDGRRGLFGVDELAQLLIAVADAKL